MLNLGTFRIWGLFDHSFLLLFAVINLQTSVSTTATDLSKKINEDVVSTPILTSGFLSTRDVNDKKANILRGRLGNNVTLPCNISTSNSTGSLSWWYRPSITRDGQLIGSLNPITRVINMQWSRDGSYELLKNGDLMLMNVRRELVARYECVSQTATNRSISFILFRLDFSFWYDHQPMSLFYGSCLSALAICTASFILNLIWIICRKTILWWINRAGDTLTSQQETLLTKLRSPNPSV